MATALPLGGRERLAQWWRLRTPAERFLIALAGAAVALVLLWLVALDPLQRDSDLLSRRLAEQRSALVEAQRQADDIAGLARAAPAPSTGDARALIESALARNNLKPAALERLDDNRWHLGLDGVAFDALTALLEGLQRDAGLRASDVSVTARVEPGQVRADVTFTR